MVYALFRIIPRVSEDPRIESTSNTITTGDGNSMGPCFNEFIIEQNLPLGVVKFTMAEGHKGSAGRITG